MPPHIRDDDDHDDGSWNTSTVDDNNNHNDDDDGRTLSSASSASVVVVPNNDNDNNNNDNHYHDTVVQRATEEEAEAGESVVREAVEANHATTGTTPRKENHHPDTKDLAAAQNEPAGDDDTATPSNDNNNDNNASTGQPQNVATTTTTMSSCRDNQKDDEERSRAAEDSDNDDDDDDYNFDSDDDDMDNEEGWTRVSQVSLGGGSIAKPFDMHRLRTCIAAGEGTLEEIRQRDVVLVVGKTGTGKSTLIQGIAGRTFQPLVYVQEATAYSPAASQNVYEPENPLQDFGVGHAKTSMTKHIRAYWHNNNNNNNRNSNTAKNKLVLAYVDTPGLEDTDGEEVDIATAAMLNEVIRQCRSLRLVVCINYVSLLEDRGGAFRSLLQLMRTLVNDWEENKKSFLFLVSHADQIQGVTSTTTNNNNNAKQHLLNEIHLTMQGTRPDSDVYKILLHMSKSLHKDWPFVDILHPTQTDFGQLAKFIEKGLKPAQKNQRGGGTGQAAAALTGTAKMRLSGETRKLLQTLRVLLRGYHHHPDNSQNNISEILEIQETFSYFEKYFNFDEVGAAIAECKDLIDDHIASLITTVETQLQKGITTTTSTAGAFTYVHVQRLTSSLEQLCALQKSYHLETERNRVIEKVSVFQNGLFLECGQSLDSEFQEKMTKLHVWCSFDPQIKSMLFDPVVEHTAKIIEGYTQYLSAFDFERVRFSTWDSFHEFVGKMKVLKSMNDLENCLTPYIPQIQEASQAFVEALDQLKQKLQKWREQTASILESLQFENEQSLEKLADQIRFLEKATNTMKKEAISGEALSLLSCIQTDIESVVVAKYVDTCNGLKEEMVVAMNNENGNESIEAKLARAQSIALLFSSSRGEQWNKMDSVYTNTIDAMKSILKTRSDEVEEMAQNAIKNGLVDGTQNGQAVMSLTSQIRFDNFLSPDDAFVQISVTHLNNLYVEHYARLLQHVAGILFQLSMLSDDAGTDSLVNTTQELMRALPEIDEYAKFGVIVGGEKRFDHRRTLYSKIEVHVQERAQTWQSTRQQWVDVVFDSFQDDESLDKITALTKILNFVLCELDVLKSMALPSEASQMLVCSNQEAITNEFQKYTEHVRRFAREDYKTPFDELAMMIQSVQALDSYPRTSPFLPGVEELKDCAQKRVSVDVKHIEDVLQSTAEFEEIDFLISELEKATILDLYLGQDLSRQVHRLKHTAMSKEHRVDEVLSQMIESDEYGSIQDFLKPLAESSDQLRKRKFDQSMKRICDRLKGIELSVCQQIKSPTITEEGAQHIAGLMETLEEAKKELSEYIRKRYNIADVIGRTTALLNKRFLSLVVQLEGATRQHDFVNIKCLDCQLSLFERFLLKYLKDSSKDRRQTALQNAVALQDAIPLLIDAFLSSTFLESRKLVSCLDGLKVATEKESDPLFVELRQTYNCHVKELGGTVNVVVEDMKDAVVKAQCYEDSIEVIDSLRRALENGLKLHLGSTLLNDCNEMLELWRTALREQKHQDQNMNWDRASVETRCEQWATQLDKLDKPDSWWVQARQWFGNRNYCVAYDRMKETVQGHIIQKHKEGHVALKKHDLSQLNECIGFLETASKTIESRHIPGTQSKLKDLQTHTCEEYINFCDHCCQVLDSENFQEFETLFAVYRSFVLNIHGLMDNDVAKRKYSATNQLVCERVERLIQDVEKIVKTFEFAKIKTKVEEARAFGGFIADRFSLLHEQLKSSGHVGVGDDKWLLKLVSLVHKHFHQGRNFSKMKSFAVLGIYPSANQREIKRAYHDMSRRFHPDKNKDPDAHLRSVQINEAFDDLKEHVKTQSHGAQPFDNEIKGIGMFLKNTTWQSLQEQHYGLIEDLLFKLSSLEVIADLVTPELDVAKIRDSVAELIKRHVDKVRIEVDSNWSMRNYQDLNLSISDLKMMEDHFKAYSDIFKAQWNTGIVQNVETEIAKLGKEASTILVDHNKVKSRLQEFRRCFLRMGAVLVELPLFKDFTKKVMCDSLEFCLQSDRGYGFIFELGLSLQKGEDAETDDEVRIAQTLVSEFRHFQDVLTMVWNEETIQKPVEDTIHCIRGIDLGSDPMKHNALHVNTEKLLEQFHVFESEYKLLLGEYLKADADLWSLVKRTRQQADKLKPVTCQTGFGESVKKVIPHVMAGVFALFTVLKSGESFNRLEDSAGVCVVDSRKLLMKPHNIQVLTLLCMFGCGEENSKSLQNQLMQIRTGEGKSMILGAAATVFGLLGLRVRCVCYSEYLSNRDFHLFKDVFQYFDLLGDVKYSKITALSEDATASKGNIRDLTVSLLEGNLTADLCQTWNKSSTGGKAIGGVNYDRINYFATPFGKENGPENGRGSGKRQFSSSIDAEQGCFGSVQGTSIRRGDEWSRTTTTSDNTVKRGCLSQQKVSKLNKMNNSVNTPIPHFRGQVEKEEILLVDEVDVFFGADFYGQTYNQVAELKEPEVAQILKFVWEMYKSGGKRLCVADIKRHPAYGQLQQKLCPHYQYLLENEVALMLDQVGRVDEEPKYHLDRCSDRIGYKVMDTVSYNITYGYRTIFAYMKEADEGNLTNCSATMARVLSMPISCGQFSYANINPARILGVSGTLEVMGDYEKGVLQKYGVNRFLYVPSVYGKSNFMFDKAGKGVSIEKGLSDFHQKITEQIDCIATKCKRAVIVFFKDGKSLKQYTDTAFYRKLGRQKAILTEEKSSERKKFIIDKAATSKQITLCTSVFGRGTDFFCKDDTVKENGGVHVIQTFLSSDQSEEIQIQGRTARQGKKGTYELILLDQDLEDDFGIKCGSSESWPHGDIYAQLCEARRNVHKEYCALIEQNLTDAEARDAATHEYFDALLHGDVLKAHLLFKELYVNMKREQSGPMSLDLAFAIDVTSSMEPYAKTIASTMTSLLDGSNSLLAKLKLRFPETQLKMRVAILGYRDIDDGVRQFQESTSGGPSRFSDDTKQVIKFVSKLCDSTSGGGDIAEDHLGAIQCCTNWNAEGDWDSTIKCILLLTDAPCHGFLPTCLVGKNMDSYDLRHPCGLTVETVTDAMLKKDINLFVCSFDPASTLPFEEQICDACENHASNKDGREVTTIPLAPKHVTGNSYRGTTLGEGSKHIIFVLDESGSMRFRWAGLVSAYNKFLHRRRRQQYESDLVSIVQFSKCARITLQQQKISTAPSSLIRKGSGTRFAPAAARARSLAQNTPSSFSPVVVFMSDGIAEHADAQNAANDFSSLNNELKARGGDELDLHVIGFGKGTNTSQLEAIKAASQKGHLYAAADVGELSKVFLQIAGGDNIATALEAEISKRISDAVTSRLAAEYLC